MTRTRNKKPVTSGRKTPVRKPRLLRSTQDILEVFDEGDPNTAGDVFSINDVRNAAGTSKVIEVTDSDQNDLTISSDDRQTKEVDVNLMEVDVTQPRNQPFLMLANSPPSQLQTTDAGFSNTDSSVIIDVDEEVNPLIELPFSSEPGSSKIGRKKHPVWDKYITVNDKSGRIVSNKCKICQLEVSCRTPRMTKHSNFCKPKKRAGVTVRSTDLPASSTSFPQKETQTNIRDAMRRWTAKEDADFADKMDTKIGKFFFGANVAFRKVESPYFIDMMKEKHEKYNPPSAKRLSTTILDEVYNECVGTLKNSLQDKKVAIVQDGWSTNQNEPVISHCLHAGSNPVFFNAVSTDTNKKTGQYCFELLEKAITKAEEQFQCKIVGVVTDNCNSMKALQSLVKAKYEELFVYGCHAHVLNLLGQDLSKEKVIEDVVAVNKFFRNHHFEGAALKKLNGQRPVLPGCTRWNSQLDALRSYKNNHTKYLEISRMEESKLKTEAQELRKVIENVTVYADVSKLLDLLTPIAVALDEVQRDTCTIADAFAKWKRLSDVLPQDPTTRASFKARMQLACPPVAAAAYLLHPVYRGKDLTRDEQEASFDFLEAKTPMLIAVAASLKSSDTNMFPKHFLQKEMIECMTSHGWWRGLESFCSIGKSVIDFCESLMLLPASSAAIERSFSTMSDIISKKRNRLSLERARKLCMVYRTLAVEKETVSDLDDDSD